MQLSPQVAQSPRGWSPGKGSFARPSARVLGLIERGSINVVCHTLLALSLSCPSRFDINERPDGLLEQTPASALQNPPGRPDCLLEQTPASALQNPSRATGSFARANTCSKLNAVRGGLMVCWSEQVTHSFLAVLGASPRAHSDRTASVWVSVRFFGARADCVSASDMKYAVIATMRSPSDKSRASRAAIIASAHPSRGKPAISLLNSACSLRQAFDAASCSEKVTVNLARYRARGSPGIISQTFLPQIYQFLYVSMCAAPLRISNACRTADLPFGGSGTQSVERKAFKAMVSFGSTLELLNSRQVSIPHKSVANARALAAEVVQVLKDVEHERAA